MDSWAERINRGDGGCTPQAQCECKDVQERGRWGSVCGKA